MSNLDAKIFKPKSGNCSHFRAVSSPGIIDIPVIKMHLSIFSTLVKLQILKETSTSLVEPYSGVEITLEIFYARLRNWKKTIKKEFQTVKVTVTSTGL